MDINLISRKAKTTKDDYHTIKWQAGKTGRNGRFLKKGLEVIWKMGAIYCTDRQATGGRVTLTQSCWKLNRGSECSVTFSIFTRLTPFMDSSL